jgi:O-antigen/teichoic acid export membrane protein
VTGTPLPPSAPTAPSAPGGGPKGGVGLSSTGVFLVTILIQLLGYIPTHFFAQNVGSVSLVTASGTVYPGQVVLGTFQLFLLIASSINMIGDLRVGTAYVFFVARGEKPEVGTGTYLVLRFVMVAIAGAAVLLLAGPIGWTPWQDLGIFALWMLLPVLWSISTVYSQLMAAQSRSTTGQFPQLLESVVRVGCLTFVAVGSLSLKCGALGCASFQSLLLPITICYLIGAGASALYSFPAVWRHTRPFRGSVAKRLFSFAWPLMGSLMLLYFSTTIIQFIVVADYQAATYTVFLSANGFRIMALAIPAAVAVPLFPHLTGLHRRRDYEVLRHRTWAALRYTAMVVIPTALTLVIYRVNFENTLYAGTYVSAAWCLALLGVSAVPASLSQIIGTALNSVGRQRLELYLTSVQFTVLVVACALLMKPLNLGGLNGLDAAGTAVLASAIAALVVNTYFMERLLGVRIQAKSVATLTGSAVVSFLVVSQFNSHIPVARFYQLLAGVILGFTVYAFMLAAVGELSKKDVELIVGALGLPRSVARVLSRLCWRVESWPVNPLPEGKGTALRPLHIQGMDDEPEEPEGRPPP